MNNHLLWRDLTIVKLTFLLYQPVTLLQTLWKSQEIRGFFAAILRNTTALTFIILLMKYVG